MNESYILQMLGLSVRAAFSASGELQCEEAIRGNTARVVFIASDASENTRKKFISKCEFYAVPCFQLEADKNTLGKALGKQQRSVAAVLDEGLARTIVEKGINRKVENSQ